MEKDNQDPAPETNQVENPAPEEANASPEAPEETKAPEQAPENAEQKEEPKEGKGQDQPQAAEEDAQDGEGEPEALEEQNPNDPQQGNPEEEEQQMKPKMAKKKKRAKKSPKKKDLNDPKVVAQKQKLEKLAKRRQEHRQELEAADKAREENKTIINVEVCYDCDEHKWCTHHKEEKYQEKFAALKLAMGEIGDGKFHVAKNLQGKPKLGAFEIYVEDKCVFSKIKRRLWPHIGMISHKIAGKDYLPKNDKNKNGIDDRLEEAGEVADINKNGVNDKNEPKVIEAYKKKQAEKAKKKNDEDDEF